MNPNQNRVEIIVDFLHSIGIPVIETSVPDDTFLPGLQLSGGTILMEADKLTYPGDLLHEAGHIAVTETKLRPFIGTAKMEKDWPNGGDEMATILWSYAACVHLNLDLEVVFHPNGYKKDSEWLVEQFNNQQYIGLPLLEWMGLCTSEEFPRMRKWLR